MNNAREIFRSNKAAIEAWLEGKPIEVERPGRDKWERVDEEWESGGNKVQFMPDFTGIRYRPAPPKLIERYEIRVRADLPHYGYDSLNKAKQQLDRIGNEAMCIVHVREVFE